MDKKIKMLFSKSIPVILIIFLFSLLVVDIHLRQKHTYQIDRLNETINILQSKQNDLELGLNSEKLKSVDTRYMIADAWMFSLNQSSREKINEVWKKIDCPMNEIDVRVMKNFYDEPAKPFRNLVIEYENGYMVFYRNGTLRCFPSKIEKMNPDSISCDKLCIKEN